MFKIEVENDGIWTDVKGSDGEPLQFASKADGEAELAKRYPVMVKMAEYAAPKRTRVISIWTEKEDKDWNS